VIVYVETNFVLQLALRQEEADAADTILERAKQGIIKLVLPAFSLSEPYSTLTYRALERRAIYNSLMRQLALLSRSEPHQQTAAVLQQLLAMWRGLERREIDLLHSAITDMMSASRTIQTELGDIQRSANYRSLYDLSPQDGIILAAIVRDLDAQDQAEAKCFISTNIKDFGDPDIRAELKSFNCRYISKLADALGFIDSTGST
jgi:predicted nucleic acid-binding protein